MADSDQERGSGQPEGRRVEDQGDEEAEEWEDIVVEQDDVIEFAEQNNTLLHAILAHPALNLASPAASPGSLWEIGNYLRHTYLTYAIPLLPPDAQYKSSHIANPYVFDYTGHEYPKGGKPASPEVDYLRDPAVAAEWPDLSTEENQEKFQQLVTRTHLIASEILGEVEGEPTVVKEKFDWEQPVPVAEIARMILGDEETIDKVRRQLGETDTDDSSDEDGHEDAGTEAASK